MNSEEIFEIISDLDSHNDRMNFLYENERFITSDFVLILLYHCEVFTEQGEFSIALEMCQMARWALSGKVNNELLKLHFYLEEIKILFRKKDKENGYKKILELKEICKVAGEDIKGGFFLDIGILLQENGYLEDSFNCFLEAQSTFEKNKDNQGLVASLTDLGVNSCERDKLEDAGKYFRLAMENAGKNSETGQNLANILMGLGYYYDLLGDYEEARKYYSLSLDSISRNSNDKLKEAHILYNLAYSSKRLNLMGPSFDYYQRSCEILREMDILYAESNYLFYKGLVLRELEHLHETVRNWTRCIFCLDKIGKGDNRKTIEFYLGDLKDIKVDYTYLPSFQENFFTAYIYRGKREFSLAPYKAEWFTGNNVSLLDYIENYKFAAPGSEYNIIVNCLKNLGNMYLDKGRYKKALEIFRETLSLQWKNGDFTRLIDTLEGLGRTYRCLEDKKKSIIFYSEAAQRSLTFQKNRGDDFDKKDNWIYLFLGQPEFAFFLWSNELSKEKDDKSVSNLFRLARLYQSLDLTKEASFFIDNASPKDS